MGRHVAFVVLATLLALVVSAQVRSPALLALGLGLAALAVLAWRDSSRRRAGLHAFRAAPASAFENETVRVEVGLENHGPHEALLVRVEDSFGASLAEARALMEAGPLAPRHRRRYAYRGDCSRGWGIHTLGPLEIRCADPLGLFPRRRHVADVAPIAVYPRLQELRFLAPGGSRPTPSPQAASVARAGEGGLFLAVREYRAGDDVRRIHWPATARLGRPAVRETEAELLPYLTVAIDLDQRHRAGTGVRSTGEAIVRTAASMLHTGARLGWLVQLLGEGARPLRLPPGSGAQHLAEGLHRLMSSRQAGKVALLDLLEREMPALPVGSSLAVVSGTIWLHDARLDRLLQAWRAQRIAPSFVLVSMDTYVPVTRLAAHPEVVRERELALQRRLRAAGHPCLVVHADEDLAAALRVPA
jgi:uncharacterized protein (DUF58 family)